MENSTIISLLIGLIPILYLFVSLMIFWLHSDCSSDLKSSQRKECFLNQVYTMFAFTIALQLVAIISVANNGKIWYSIIASLGSIAVLIWFSFYCAYHKLSG